MNGALRLRRQGGSIAVFIRETGDWTKLGEVTGPLRPAILYLASSNVNTRSRVATTFRDFRLSSGRHTFRAYSLPDTAPWRDGLLAGFVSSPVLQIAIWGGYPGFDPFPILRTHGMNAARVRVTTVSSPALRDTPFPQWRNLPWRDEYWACLELAEQQLLQAQRLGMKTYLELFMSDHAADGGHQEAPAEWKGLSIEDTLTRVEEYCYRVAQYFKEKGIRIDYYAPGNEIGTGLLNFRPGERLPNPPNSKSPFEATGFMRDTVWPVEARILRAAIAGIRRADPGARTVVHIAGQENCPADIFAKDFFRAMVDFGVPFDVAGLSLPYPQPGWTGPQYSTECLFQRLDETVRAIRQLGKPVLLAEGGYFNRPDNTSAPNDPLRDFAFSEAGQAAWVNAHLRFTAATEGVLGFLYTFPEWFPGLLPPPEPKNITALGLFSSPTTVRPALKEFLVALAPSVVTTVSAATFLRDAPLAPESIASGFGLGLALTTELAPPNPPLPTSLAGTTVKVTDSAASERLASLWFVSPGQINYYVPEGTKTGPATVTVERQNRALAAGAFQIDAVAPGLFSANANGRGVAAAIAVRAKPDGSQSWQHVFPQGCVPGSCVSTPIDLGPETDLIFLLLYGTGIRGRSSLSAVTAKIGGVDAPVEYAGPVAGFTGLDQVNVRVPRSLMGRGEVNVQLTVGGRTANTVTVNIR
jgi:uncharacterized protein (TIGR03437 family)